MIRDAPGHRQRRLQIVVWLPAAGVAYRGGIEGRAGGDGGIEIDRKPGAARTRVAFRHGGPGHRRGVGPRTRLAGEAMVVDWFRESGAWDQFESGGFSARLFRNTFEEKS